jgi:predicted nucleic acid-binding protein
VTVVSNASPLIILARIGHLQLLADLYGRVVIPSEVHDEVVVAGRGRPGSEEAREASWIDVRPITDVGVGGMRSGMITSIALRCFGF